MNTVEPPDDGMRAPRAYFWSATVLVLWTPFLLVLCDTLWRTPFPLREGVAILEDVARARHPVFSFLVPESSYYRPLFYVTMSALWHGAGTLDATLAGIRLLHILPILVLVTAFIWQVRPRTSLDAAAAALAVAVLVGSGGFRDNLEIPLSYTIVGMPAALLIWMLLNRDPRPWRAPAIALLTLVAVGFKEQGLVIVPLVVAAWWMRAPGASGRLALSMIAAGIAYVAARLFWHQPGPLFEQAIGLGFSQMEPPEATARFGAFPLWIFAYNGLSTMANVLFAEPTRGVFAIVRTLAAGVPDVWQMVHLLSSATMTAIIAWWGLRALKTAALRSSPDARLFVAFLIVLLASGVLSFDYSRDRLGGMAVVFYALAGYFAVRAAAERVTAAPAWRRTTAAVVLVLLAAGWHARAFTTIEIARLFSSFNQMDWLLLQADRRVEFAERPVYLDIMRRLSDQGTDPAAPRATRYPVIVNRTLGLPGE